MIRRPTVSFVSSEDRLASEVDAYIQAAPNATVFHTLAWNRIVRDIFDTRFAYAVARDEYRIVGVMPCHWVPTGGWGTVCYSPPRIFEVPYGGPVGDEDAVCVELVRRALRARLGSRLEVFSTPGAGSWVDTGAWRHLKSMETAYVDLRRPMASIWKSSLDGNRRNMVRKAQRSGVQLVAGGAEFVDTYYDLVRQMAERSRITLHPPAYYRRVLQTFEPSGQARLLLAYVAGRPVAGGIFLRFSRAAYYWHGATASGAPNHGQGELLQWNAVKWAHAAGCEWYDLVGIESERLPHIARFKLGFTRQIVPVYQLVHMRLVDRLVRRVLSATWGRS